MPRAANKHDTTTVIAANGPGERVNRFMEHSCDEHAERGFSIQHSMFSIQFCGKHALHRATEY